ncbi:iron chelate uptake ABC transporter family permease subunit [Sedimentibacter sp. zth1]|uniref:FecCD family ABC transporter permease n=1 Tax=Sedimentibacter sp. zth1 TaxID=2816908 RepID=UPI001A9296FD|nr:iron chelate uptake ABC transporter family permease subunit [Sedimentibacter sp. zth1]QSX06053.1 iron chelate uptake ABC transporter family permease subunit [Sedimentibacter sp. zth1]
MKKNTKLIILISIVVLFLTVLICSCIGAANISIGDSFKIIINKILGLEKNLVDMKSSTITIIWKVRFPRILVSLIVGGALSIAGVTYQGLLKNPMADPYVIGVSSGAAFGAAIGIASHITFKFFGLSIITILAFSCAVGVMFLVYSISRIGKKVPITTLLLSGIAVGNFLTAFTSLIMIFAGDDLSKIYFWTMGSFSGKGWSQLVTILPYVLIGFAILFYYSKDLNLILLGEETASNLGVNVEKVKLILLVTSTIVTAFVVSISGIIGFVGLIIPHITRMIIGPDHKKLFPLSFIFGAILMVICDTLARSVFSQEIPVGLVTAILGGPFFVYLLRSKKRELF